MLVLLSAMVAAACVAASARRLAWAVAPTTMDTQLLLEALRGDVGTCQRASLREAIEHFGGAGWERALWAAAEIDDDRSRVALFNEELLELDWRMRRWERVPRVCASVATSAGFLFACVALMRGLSLEAPDVGTTLWTALDALCLGIAGSSFCVAAHLRAGRAVRRHLAATDRLVDALAARWVGARPGDPFPFGVARVR